MNLPEPFTEKIRDLLGPEADSFFYALSHAPKTNGLRVNTLKIRPEDFLNLLDIPLTPVLWCPAGFYYPAQSENRPSKNPLYHAGLYYLQEPSAMAPVEVLAPKPGDKVLDICAAPGGKSVQIAGHMQGRGLLVSNDASASRCRALVKNLTLCGAKNAVILKETPNRLAPRFEEFFDKILVDAPCSGEGMFRKDPDAIKSWNANKPETCIPLQQEILHYSAAMLKPGGHMVYSTCTFDPRENEGIINKFLNNHPSFELISMKRLWPHKIEGEGHFICKLSKTLKTPPQVHTNSQSFGQAFTKACGAVGQSPTVFDFLKEPMQGPFMQHGSALFAVPDDMPDLSGLRVARSGWYLGEIKRHRRFTPATVNKKVIYTSAPLADVFHNKDRFEPSCAFALGLTFDCVKYAYNLQPDLCIRYLKGESFEANLPYPNKSRVLMCISDFPLGWAYLVNGRLKNKYPRGWIIN